MESEFVAAYRAARRRYEVARLAVALRHAAMLALLIALIAGVMFGRRALVWLPVTLIAVTVAEWRGVFLMKGARRGLVAGFASMLLPLSLLRPCCGIDGKAMGVACCTMPGACWAAGALVGVAMSSLFPKVPEGRRAEAALGMILGVTSVAVFRCSMLFLGEAVGLVGGMAAGVVVSSFARAWWSRARLFA
jgi:hypothetical protein